MILLIDNYDSFTYNLVNQFIELGVEVDVVTNDIPTDQLELSNYKGVVISPGPSLPKDSNNLFGLMNSFVGELPVLGVCLGLEALIEYFGGELKRLERPYHGIEEEVFCTGEGLFRDLNGFQKIVRYHSWVGNIIPSDFVVTSMDENKEVMAIESNHLKAFGVQFHPESLLTQNGGRMLQNWLRKVDIIPTY